MDGCQVVIMAGGQGERLWPLSTARRPKQFQRLVGGRTPFEQVFERALALAGAPEGVWTVTRRAYRDLIRNEFPGFVAANIIAEPCQRNTAPCLALAAALISRERPADDVMVAMPADHHVADGEALVAALEAAASEARRTGALICLGVAPTRPHTGYGYIELEKGPEGEASRRVRRFTEKPGEPRAREFAASGRHLWNAGIFVWPLATFFAELAAHAPEISRLAEAVRTAPGDPWPLIEAGFCKLPDISIDYALLERSANIRAVPVSCGWSDLGSFSALAEALGRNASGNAVAAAPGAAVTFEEARNLFVYEGCAKPVVVCGLGEAVVVDTAEGLLVCGAAQEGRVKELGRGAEQAARGELTVGWRPWGMWETLARGAGFQVKRLRVAPHQRLSLQAHRHRAEHWVVLAGRPLAEVEGRASGLAPGGHIFIPQGARHRLANPGEEEVVIIEVQLGEVLSEEDITRFSDDYGRV